MAVVGIDLGTTNTVIAAVRDGRATALKDKLGRALLPSVVSFSMKGNPIVGYPAKDRRTIDPENTIFSTKRLIGRTFDSDPVKKALTRLPFRIKEGPGKATLVEAHGKDYTLPEISALVLQEAAIIAESRLGSPISDVVITVPANFNDLQRAATKVAGRTAGLEVLRIINEPTAAALAYGFGKRGRERIAVYDFGGGTFDVTLLDLSENVFEVLATAGDTFLGGDDIDRAIMDRMAELLFKEQKVDASKDNLVREQLRAAAEVLKIELSTRSMAKAKVDDLDFEFTMRRSEFEKLCEPLLARTLDVCQEAMDIAGVSVKELDQVLLVGGSTRIPLVRRRISSFFGKMPQSRINPDEVVAIGAAIQASSLEAKQGTTNVPTAPRPRAGLASAHPSRAPAPLGARKPGNTQTGLAGLKKTLQGPGVSDAPPGTTQGSVLSGLKASSVSPPVGGPKLGPAKTLAGVGPSPSPSVNPDGPRGKMQTLSGVGENNGRNMKTLSGVDAGRKRGSTNLGLGASPSSPPPVVGGPPPRATAPQGIDFDEVTTIQAQPDLLAAATEMGRAKQTTLPGAAAPPTTDGSVTFDLEALEALEGGDDFSDFDSLEDENTQILEPSVAEAHAARLDEQASSEHHDLPEDEDTDLPTMPMNAKPMVSEAPMELGDSALFALEEDFADEDEEIAGLPAAAKISSPTAAARKTLSGGTQEQSVVELGDSALFSMETLEDDESVALPSAVTRESDDIAGLPAPARPAAHDPAGLGRTRLGVAAPANAPAGKPDPFEDDAIGLPAPAAEAALPAPVGFAKTALGLPSPAAAGLPQRRNEERSPDSVDAEAALPLVGGSLPAKRDADLGLGRTQLGAAGPDFAAAARAPAGSVHDLEDLSVSAPLPSEDEELADFALHHQLGATQLGVAPQASPAAGRQSAFDLEPGGALDDELIEEDFAADELDFGAPLQDAAPEAEPLEEMHGDTQTGYAPPYASPMGNLAQSAGAAPTGAPLLLDVTPLSLGVEVVGGYVDRLIERNSPVPCERTRTFATASDNQAIVRVRVSQGEEGRFLENTVLGEVQLTGLPPGPRGSVKIDVSFSLDESGILQVSARDQSTGAAANARLMLAGVAEQ